MPNSTLTLGDRSIHRLGYGAMRITGDGVWGPPKDKAAALDVLRETRELGIAFIPWYPLDAGAVDNPVLQKIAGDHDATVYQIALAWLLHRADNILLIPGTGSVAHLRENTAARDIRLSEEDMEALSTFGR